MMRSPINNCLILNLFPDRVSGRGLICALPPSIHCCPHVVVHSSTAVGSIIKMNNERHSLQFFSYAPFIDACRAISTCRMD